MQGVTTAFFEDVWSRNFLNIFATPLSISEYLLGLVFSSICHQFGRPGGDAGAGDGGFRPVVLRLWAGADSVSAGPVCCSASRWGLSQAPWCCGWARRRSGSSGRFRRSFRRFAGVFYPLSTLPLWMQAFAHVLPPSYVFESMRSIVAGRAGSPAGLLAGASLVIVYIAGACLIFASVYRRAVRTGLIARYSAESVN